MENYNCSISAYEIQKIFKSHGNEKTEAPRGQRAITEADIVDIPDILQNADSIVLSNEKYEGKPVIVFTRNGNGRISLVGVVSDKHLDLFVQTMYANKKGNLATPMDEQSPIFTPKAARGTVSDNSIRDTAGNVNTQDKYSMRDVTEGDTKQELAERKKAYAQLRRENAALKARVDYLKGQTKLTKEATVREADTAALAKRLLKDYTSRADSAGIQRQLQELGNYIVQNDGRTLSYDEIRERADSIAEEIADDAFTVLSPAEESLAEYTEYLRKTPVKITDGTAGDFVNGAYREISRRIKLRNDGRGVDSVWRELQGMFGEDSARI